MKAFLIALTAVALSAPVSAQWLDQPTAGLPRSPDGKPNLSAPAPRTPDGKPDLSGLWTKISPKYSRNIAADLKAEEILPWARALVEQRREDLGKEYMNVRCVPLGPGYTTAADSTGAEMMKIVQTPGLIIILNPDLTYRQIFLDGRALEAAPNPTWMGYSVGRWDGDTLVVESAGFNDRTWLDYSGHPHTEALRTTERYTRKDFGHMDIHITYSDPKAYARPWTITLHGSLMPDTELLENVCNENDKSSRQHFLITDDDKRKGQAEFVIPANVLSSYAGPYDMKMAGKSIPSSVVFENGRLYVVPPGSGRMPLVAESETTFSALGAPVIFRKDASGAVTGFVIHTVEGDQEFERKR
jgi:hypothetical protein